MQNEKGRASLKDVRPFDKKIERETGLEPVTAFRVVNKAYEVGTNIRA